MVRQRGRRRQVVERGPDGGDLAGGDLGGGGGGGSGGGVQIVGFAVGVIGEGGAGVLEGHGVGGVGGGQGVAGRDGGFHLLLALLASGEKFLVLDLGLGASH